MQDIPSDTPIDPGEPAPPSLAGTADREAVAFLQGALNIGSIDRDRAVLEQAKGALMLHYGIGSHEAFGLLLRWSLDAHTGLHAIADTLMHEVCRTSRTVESRRPHLVRWLRDQLDRGIPGQ